MSTDLVKKKQVRFDVLQYSTVQWQIIHFLPACKVLRDPVCTINPDQLTPKLASTTLPCICLAAPLIVAM